MIIGLHMFYLLSLTLVGQEVGYISSIGKGIVYSIPLLTTLLLISRSEKNPLKINSKLWLLSIFILVTWMLIRTTEILGLLLVGQFFISAWL